MPTRAICAINFKEIDGKGHTKPLVWFSASVQKHLSSCLSFTGALPSSPRREGGRERPLSPARGDAEGLAAQVLRQHHQRRALPTLESRAQGPVRRSARGGVLHSASGELIPRRVESKLFPPVGRVQDPVWNLRESRFSPWSGEASGETFVPLMTRSSVRTESGVEVSLHRVQVPSVKLRASSSLCRTSAPTLLTGISHYHTYCSLFPTDKICSRDDDWTDVFGSVRSASRRLQTRAESNGSGA